MRWRVSLRWVMLDECLYSSIIIIRIWVSIHQLETHSKYIRSFGSRKQRMYWDIINTPGKAKENARQRGRPFAPAHAPSDRLSRRNPAMPAMHFDHKTHLTYMRSSLGAPCFKIQSTYVHAFLRELAVKFGPCPVSVLIARPRGNFLGPWNVVLGTR